MKYAKQATILNNMVYPTLAAANVSEVPSFPYMITITTTYNCNYRCSMCYQKSYDKKEIPWEYIAKIEDALPFVDKIQIFGGEPLLYSRYDDLVRLCGKYDVGPATITNGSLLNKDRAKAMIDNGFGHVKVSMDAGTSESYKRIRGGNFSKVLNNIAYLAQEKAKAGVPLPFVEMNFVAMKSNVHELGRLAVIGSSIGVDQINVYYMRATKKESALDSLYFCQEYSDEQIMKGLGMANEIGIPMDIPKLFAKNIIVHSSRNVKACHDPWKFFLINVEGDCTACCGNSPKLGSLRDSTFQELWNGPMLQKLRSTVNTENELACCRKCSGRKQSSDGIETHFSSRELYEWAAGELGKSTEVISQST